MNYVSHQRTWPRPGPTVHPHRVYTRSAKNYTQESGNGLSRSKQSISSLSAHSKSYVSNQQNWPRSWSNVHPHKIWMRSVKTYTWESCNGISRSKPLITLGKRPFYDLHLPWTNSAEYECDPWRIAPGRTVNGLRRSKSLISSLSAHLKSYVSHEQIRLRSWPKVHPTKYEYNPQRTAHGRGVMGLAGRNH